MADEGSLNLLHTTFAQILVETDVSKVLPSKIFITTSKGSWVQHVDFEGVPFRCRRCFKTRHNTASCDRHRVERPTTWWKEVTPQHYTVEKVEVNQKIPQILSGGHKDVNEKEPEIKESSDSPKSWEIKQGMIGNFEALVKDCVNVGSCSNQAGREKVQGLGINLVQRWGVSQARLMSTILVCKA